jgi:hypothetical protein
MSFHTTFVSALLTGLLAIGAGCDRGKSDGDVQGTPVSGDAIKAVGHYSAKSGSSAWELDLKDNGTATLVAAIPEPGGQTTESSASGTWSMSGQTVTVNLTKAASDDDDIPADDRTQTLTLSPDGRTLKGTSRKYLRQ